jgi:hypothetical protein
VWALTIKHRLTHLPPLSKHLFRAYWVWPHKGHMDEYATQAKYENVPALTELMLGCWPRTQSPRVECDNPTEMLSGEHIHFQTVPWMEIAVFLRRDFKGAFFFSYGEGWYTKRIFNVIFSGFSSEIIVLSQKMAKKPCITYHLKLKLCWVWCSHLSSQLHGRIEGQANPALE